MARIRTVKPDFWQDEDLAAVSETACLLALGLLNHSDDEGFFNANPRLVTAAIFPIREPSSSVHELLIELQNIGYLELFEGSDGKNYGHIKNFTRHQKINRPSESKIKHLSPFSDDSVSSHGELTLGKERKGKERNVRVSEFDEFWKRYPKRRGKEPALKAWLKLNPDENLQRKIFQAIETQSASRDWQKEGGQFIPYPATWLNQHRWEDEPSLRVVQPEYDDSMYPDLQAKHGN